MFRIALPLTLAITVLLFLGCGGSKNEKSEAVEDNARAKKKNKKKNKKKKKDRKKGQTTEQICMRVHNAGFRNGWLERPRKLKDCQLWLSIAKRNAEKNGLADSYLKKIGDCTLKNVEAEFKECVGSLWAGINISAEHKKVVDNVDLIRKAEIAYQAANKSYLEAALYPAQSASKTKWDAAQSGGFATIGFQPSDAQVTGSFKVEVSAEDFTVFGVVDSDGDGVFATYKATKSTDPEMVTASDVY